MTCSESITADIDLSTTIERLSDKERTQWLKAMLETVQEEGTITWMRSIVNNPQWDDQPPTHYEQNPNDPKTFSAPEMAG